MGEAIGAGCSRVEAILMGRVLYEEWAAYWPEHADEPFGDVINPTKKYVVSNNLRGRSGRTPRSSAATSRPEVAALKAQDGGDIAMSGSATTVRWLLREGLLDELHLLVHPIVVGEGMARLFPPDEPQAPLELLSSETFETGVLGLRYAPVKD